MKAFMRLKGPSLHKVQDFCVMVLKANMAREISGLIRRGTVRGRRARAAEEESEGKPGLLIP